MSLDISISSFMIALLTDPGVGGTFLNWTVHYLAGNSEYFHATANKFIKLTENPLAEYNAHNFQPNQPKSLVEFDRIHSSLLKANVDSTIYFHNFHGSSLKDNNHTQQAINKVIPTASKIIVVELQPQHALYQCSYIPRSKYSQSFVDHSTTLSTPDAVFDDFTSYFFNASKQKWDDANLTNVWDKREFIALNINPFDIINVTHNTEITVPYYELDAVNLMTIFDQLVPELFDYLGVDLCESRLEQWASVYSRWKLLHLQRLTFMQQFDCIVNNILAGNDFDLECFGLDIRQEAAIQHQLLYKHNLNFKTWQLTKFVNTKQLHDLLEPNIYHDLNQYLEKR